MFVHRPTGLKIWIVYSKLCQTQETFSIFIMFLIVIILAHFLSYILLRTIVVNGAGKILPSLRIDFNLALQILFLSLIILAYSFRCIGHWSAYLSRKFFILAYWFFINQKLFILLSDHPCHSTFCFFFFCVCVCIGHRLAGTKECSGTRWKLMCGAAQPHARSWGIRH